jgi:hypothetical protein
VHGGGVAGTGRSPLNAVPVPTDPLAGAAAASDAARPDAPPPDPVELEQARWSAFVAGLSSHLAAQWPAMPERLGDRYAAFVEHAVQTGQQRGLSRAASLARYVNLCFVWGPSFQDKPGFEWAAGMLAAPREREWATLHQMVRRSMAELQRLSGSRITPQALALADERLIDLYGHLGVRGALHPAEPPPAPRRACDLLAAELRLHAAAVSEHYVCEDGQWQRVALPPPPPVRMDAAQAAPRLVGVLAHPPGRLPQARLQLRVQPHAVCDAAVHPALNFIGSHGRWRWLGHETRAASWPVATLEPPLPAGGAGSAIAEETSPDIHPLSLQVCGLRDEGDALGRIDTQVWAWPATQWWLEVRRSLPAGGPVVPDRAPARGHTRCRLEADGQPQDAGPLKRGFEEGLDGAVAAALQALLRAWSGVAGLTEPQLEGSLALLTGQAACTWGWQLGPRGLDGRALMRLVGELDMQALQVDLQFGGTLAVAGAQAHLALRCHGGAPLRLPLRREAAEPALLPVLLPALVRFSLPFEAELTPLAADSGALLQTAGPCSGTLAGEAGLRPRTSGGSGFEWFAALRLEAVNLPLATLDPLLGHSTQLQPLLPAQALLDWRLG